MHLRIPRRRRHLLHLLLLLLALLHLLLVPRRQVLHRLGPHEWPLELHRHVLGRPRAVPAVGRRSARFGILTGDTCLFDVGAHAEDAHVVGVVEVVAEVELAEPEGDSEAGELWGLVVGAEEGDGESGTGWVLAIGGRDCVGRSSVQEDLFGADAEGSECCLCRSHGAGRGDGQGSDAMRCSSSVLRSSAQCSLEVPTLSSPMSHPSHVQMVAASMKHLRSENLSSPRLARKNRGADLAPSRPDVADHRGHAK